MYSLNLKPSLLAVGALTLGLTACGGGGGSTAAPSATGPTPPAATTAVTYVTGAISGFGSVIINGVRYESDSATVSKEGKSATQTDLKTGEVITLRAEKGADGINRAKAIEQSRLVQGPVTAIDTAAETLTIAGTVIAVTADTVFDAGITGRLAGIAVGDRIEVHGFAGATTGTATATRIEKADPADTEIEVTGKVTALDATAKRFTIGTQVVDYSTATFLGLAASGPADGELVEVKGTSLLADGALKATRVKKEDGGLKGAKGDTGELSGTVTSFVSATDFVVNGQKVTTTSSTVYVGGTSADLKADAKLEVEGKLDTNGNLVADKIIFKREATFELMATVEAVTVDAADATAGTLRVLGVTFVVNADTRKEDERANNHYFKLADLAAGDWVEVAAVPDATDPTKWVATKIERKPVQTQAEVEGLAEQLATNPLFKVGPVSIDATNSSFRDAANNRIDIATFFALTGVRVSVEGTVGTGNLVATKVRVRPARTPR
jgi:hypothetical protein